MPGVSQVIFAALNLSPDQIRDRRVLDVGSCNFNGSIKPLIQSYEPREYLGIDIIAGRDVDLILPASSIVQQFGRESFDILVCLEMLEHAKEWKTCIMNMKEALTPGGIIILTTRSEGYPCHGFPNDFWRFSVDDMRLIFADFEDVRVEADAIEPGVFVRARRPQNWTPITLEPIEISSIITGRRERALPPDFSQTRYYKRLRMRESCKSIYQSLTRFLGRFATTVLLQRR